MTSTAMPDTPLTERQESLLSHLESVYLLAQAISPDARTAARLVEAAYTQAFVTIPLSSPARDEKRWLFRLLVQIHHEQPTFERVKQQEEDAAEAPPEVLGDVRRRLAGQIADRALPTVLATLPDEHRLMVLLCDAEDLSCEDAGFVLGLDATTAFQRLDQARATVNTALRTHVSEQERPLLDRYLPVGWLRPALRRAVETEFDLLPSGLRHALLAATLTDKPAPEPPPEPQAEPVAPLKASPSTENHPRPAPTKPARGPRLRRLVVVTVLVAAVATLGYFVARSLDRPIETNLITLSVKQADAIRPSLETNNPTDAEAYVWTELQRRLTLPSIDQASLSGVGLREVAPTITVPVFLYDDTAEQVARRITLYVFSYALLERHQDRLQLEPEILRQIQDDRRFDLHDLGERNVLVWRNRDDIYVAVTPGDPEGLRQRIVFPS